MKKILSQILLLVLFIFIFWNTSSASMPLYIDKEWGEYQEINYSNKSINFWKIKVDYNIWFKNEINQWINFLPINLKFSEKINWVLNIYKEEFYYKNWDKYWKWEELHKSIKIQNTTKKISYFHKWENNYKYYFYLNVNNISKKLNIKNNEIYYSGELYIINSWKKLNNNISISEITDLFLLKQFNKIFIKKDKLLNLELKILKNYIFSWWNIILNQNLFNKYFWENKEIRKIEYSKNCTDYDDCSNWSNYHKKFYWYWFWNIYIEKKYRYIQNNNNLFLNNSEIKNILIDKVIESKFVPFNIILYFVIIYFLSLIIINFIFWKKLKNNKFFLFYSIPSTSLIFLIIIISISIYFRWFNDIENKIQINHHINDKILKQVYIANFSAQWWDYEINFNKEDFSKILEEDYRYNKNYSKKETSIENWIINKKILWFNSSGLLYFNYSKIEDSLSTKGFNPLKKFSTKFELLNYFNMTEDEMTKNDIINFRGITSKEEEQKNNKIKEITVSENETEYMKKYSYWWIKNQNLVIDVFYK